MIKMKVEQHIKRYAAIRMVQVTQHCTFNTHAHKPQAKKMILQHLILEPRALLLHMTYAPRSQESTAGLWGRKWKFQVFLSTVRCCSPVCDCLSSHLSDTLLKLQNRAARVITKSPYDTSSSLLLNKLKWEKLSKHRQTQKALIMFKTIHKLGPKY